MSDWYQHQNWDDQIHAEFYDAYRQASPAVRAIALVEQAELLSKHLDNTTLKAAESLLILWMSRHYSNADARKVYLLLKDICSRIGDHERSKEFQRKLENL